MISAFFAFFLSLASILVLLKTPLGKLALDRPNERSLHSKVIPRTGGLALMSSVLLTWVFIGASWIWIFLIVLLLGLSLLDDIQSLPVWKRFAVHFLASLILIKLLLTNVTWWEFSILLLGMVWMTNLYNFMDGSDGLAGGMAVLGFSTYALVAWVQGNMLLATMSAVVVGASLAFLIFNFHPARIFMGDSGSVPLGFFAGAIGIYGWQLGLWPLWFPLLTFSPFIVDATVTLIKRVIKKERFWQAHKDHYYQRLIRLGWGHRRVALAEYALMMAVAVSGILLINQNSVLIYLVLGSWLIIYVYLMHMIDKKWCVYSTAIQ